MNGAGFVSGAAVQWNGTALTTTFVSATQLTAQVPATLIAMAGTATVTVVENGVTSAGASFTIAAGPVITSLSPSTATAGGAAFTLTVNGTGFVSGAAVQWNGTALTTTFVSATQLTAQVPATLIATAGTATVTVVENGVTSAGASFTIPVAVLSGVSLTGLPATGAPGQQPSLGLGLSSPATVPLTGTLTLTFTPDPKVTNWPSGYSDAQFASGCANRQSNPPPNPCTTNFTIAAGATTATLPDNGGIQLGTVAGTVTVALTSLSEGGASALPQPAPSVSVNLPLLAPVITSGSVKIIDVTSTGFEVQLDAASTSRDLTSATFTFQAASGTDLNGSTPPPVQLGSEATTYFLPTDTSASQNGGSFELTVPFAFSGDTSALNTVSVTLTNSVGISSPVTGGVQQ